MSLQKFPKGKGLIHFFKMPNSSKFYKISVVKHALLYLIVTFIFSTFSFAQPKPKIGLVYFNHLDKQLEEKIKFGIESTYNCVIIPSRKISLPSSAFNLARNRFRAEKLLDYLKTISNYKNTIGITTKDISTTKDNHLDWGVMGLGRYNVCVISTYRLCGSYERAVKVAIHEAGHCLKLLHCSNALCVMTAGDGTAKNLDKSSRYLCNSCKQKFSF